MEGKLETINSAGSIAQIDFVKVRASYKAIQLSSSGFNFYAAHVHCIFQAMRQNYHV